MKLAVVKDNKISFIIEDFPNWEDVGGYTTIPFEQAEGMEYEDHPKSFYPITPRQLRLWLLYKGKLNLVQTAIDQLPEPQKTGAQIEWEHAIVFLREHPMVGQIGSAIGLTEEELDEAFTVSPFWFP